MSEKTSVTGSDVSVTTIGNKGQFDLDATLVKAETQKAEIQSFINGSSENLNAVTPPYHPLTLQRFARTSPTLAPCIDAMEINVDGTGHSIQPIELGDDEKYLEDPQYLAAVSLFAEPYPKLSMIKLRRQIRQDTEELGYAYIEVIRNAAEEPVFLRYLDAKYMRLIKHNQDDLVTAPITITRNGVEKTVNMEVYERRLVYNPNHNDQDKTMSGSSARFYREYGTSRHVDRKTGRWGGKGQKLKTNDRGSEVLILIAKRDIDSPYGIPRWIAQAASVAGEKEAEKLNLTYFDNGGIPPIMIFLQNGRLTPDSKESLEMSLKGGAKDKQNGTIVETVASGGTLDKPSNMQVRVERFGSDKQNDAMFLSYGADCYTKIRSSYRLPPMFLGRTEGYNYATAVASYTVAETQVFKPERDEFDALLNSTIMREIAPDYKFVSNPMVVTDSDVQLRIMEMLANRGAISNQELVDKSNLVANMQFEWNGEEPSSGYDELLGLLSTPDEELPEKEQKAKSEILGLDTNKLTRLTEKWVHCLKSDDATDEDRSYVQKSIGELTPLEMNVVEWQLAAAMIPKTKVSLDDVALNTTTAKMSLKAS